MAKNPQPNAQLIPSLAVKMPTFGIDGPQVFSRIIRQLDPVRNFSNNPPNHTP
ncbi:MAG: hypothetical protein Q8Q59_10265 [Luteolibacter sp.]|jgi:hypothetical protein|nr:hypothetical protein [Luteolibacter sp.]